MSKSESEVLDLEDRDIQQLNQHLEVTWESIIGEPHEIRSPECAWSISQHCFKFSRQGVYICLSVLCAPIAACVVGVSFACLQFQHIWCIGPCLRSWRISCGAARHFVLGCTHGILIPIMVAFGHILSQIKIRNGTLQEHDDFNEKHENVLIV